MSSPNVVEMPTRDPDTVKVLDKIFNLSPYDLETLHLCHRDYKHSKFGLSISESQESARRESVERLLTQSMIEFNDANHVWELTDIGTMVLRVIQLLR